MIRTGIYSLNQLNRPVLKDIFGKEKNISIYLYQKINQIDNIKSRTEFAELILNRFNSDRNVIKRTYKNRYNNFDNITVKKILEQKFKKTSVLDIAISDGRASCYFLEQANKQLQNFSYTGSDIHIDYYLNKKKGNAKSYLITDEDKKIIEITCPPFVWNLARTEGAFYFINNLLKNFFFKRTQIALLNNEFKFQEKIELIHPDFKTQLEQSTDMGIINYNLFDEITEEYNVIRVMNILHTGYFTINQLSAIFNNLYNGLEPNGLLIEGSNENAGTPVDGAIYKKSGRGFVLICEPENSSRIKELVLSFKGNN